MQAAVHQHAAVGVEAAHDILPRLDADLIPAVAGDRVRRDLPCRGLSGLIPVRAADRIIDHLDRIGRGNGIGIIVVARIKRRGGFVFCRLALDAVKRGGRAFQLRLGGSLIFRSALRLTEGDALDADRSLDAGERQRMFSLCQMKDQRIIEQAVLVVDEFRLPAGLLDLRGTHLIAAGIRLDLVFVDEDLVETDARCGFKGRLAVQLQRKLDLIRGRFQRVIGNAHGIDALLRHVEVIGDLALCGAPDQHIVLLFAALAERADGKIAVLLLCGILSADRDLLLRPRRGDILIIIVAVAFFLFKVQGIEVILCCCIRGRRGRDQQPGLRFLRTANGRQHEGAGHDGAERCGCKAPDRFLISHGLSTFHPMRRPHRNLILKRCGERVTVRFCRTKPRTAPDYIIIANLQNIVKML